MSLQIWLPLTKDLRNQGVMSSTITNNGVTYNASGKLGGCYSFNGGSSYLMGTQNKISNSTDNWTFSCWMKLNAITAGQCLFSCRTAVTESGISIFYYGSQWLVDDGVRWQFTPTTAIVKDTWYHICIVRQKGIGKFLYVNGTLDKSTTTTGNQTYVNNSYFSVGLCQNSETTCLGNPLNGYLNDVRFYDHALSMTEIKELSRGLVCHYKLDSRVIQSMNNCFSSPTFDTSSSTGGWKHWGATGHKGSYGQTTDKTYIYHKSNTYAHWIQNDADATQDYLVYQSPSFEGGFRSLCCILKEENSLPISESIIYPDWNANVSGGVPRCKWTSVTHLGDGFYLCKCEGFKQDGSNDLVGLYIKPEYKVYISECYLENDRTTCSEILYPSSSVIDSSGYGHHGQIWKYNEYGNVQISNETPRNSISTYINSEDTSTSTASGTVYIYGNCELTTPNYLTVAFWCKPFGGYADSVGQGQFCLTMNDIGSGAGSDYSTAPMHNRDSNIDMCTSENVHKTVVINFTKDEWHHYAIVYDGRYGRIYKDGVSANSVDMGSTVSLASMKAVVIGFSKAGGAWRSNKSIYSDFRIYTTALSANDILELYQIGAKIDYTGKMHSYELNEGNI